MKNVDKLERGVDLQTRTLVEMGYSLYSSYNESVCTALRDDNEGLLVYDRGEFDIWHVVLCI